uniref:hypothetical protein n=2 Tax=Flavobacterium sp. TaxID=239 RepID=UPI00404B6084
MKFRIFSLLFLMLACKSADSFVIDNTNCEVLYAKILGNKTSSKPMVAFEIKLKVPLPNQVECKELQFHDEKMDITKTSDLSYVSNWMPNYEDAIKEVSYDFVDLIYEENGQSKQVKLALKKQKPLFEPMLPKQE